MAMQCGIFMTPYNPPHRTPRQVFDWALDIARIADEAGYVDFMIGEHYTLGWENQVLAGQFLGRDDGDRDRHGLRVFRTLARDDGDFARRVRTDGGLGRGFGGLWGGFGMGAGGDRQGAGGQQHGGDALGERAAEHGNGHRKTTPHEDARNRASPVGSSRKGGGDNQVMPLSDSRDCVRTGQYGRHISLLLQNAILLISFQKGEATTEEWWRGTGGSIDEGA